MLDIHGIMGVTRLTQARRFDAAQALLYHNLARFAGLCESSQPHSAAKRAFCVPSEANVIKQCEVCRIEFKVKPSHATRRKYCSNECRAIGIKETMRGENNPNYRGRDKSICPQCGKMFRGHRKDQEFCSQKCYQATGRNRAPRDRSGVTVSCVVCGKDVYMAPSRYKRGDTPRCKRCRGDTSKRVQVRAKQVGTVYQLAFLDQFNFRWCTCIKCGKRFQYHNKGKKFCLKCASYGEYFRRCPTCKTVFITDMKRQKFCSRKCYNKVIADRQRGEQSHLWKGGTTRPEMLLRGSMEYGDWRKAVFARDDYTCQLCYERGGKLAAHHIREYAKYPDLRLTLSNGITLCWPCHQSVKGEERLYETTFYDITGGI